MIDTISKWLLFLAFAATILVVGWKQPLRFRFMSPAQIYAFEHPTTPTPAPTTPWMQDPTRRTLLDGGSYGTRRGPGAARIYDPRGGLPTPNPYR